MAHSDENDFSKTFQTGVQVATLLRHRTQMPRLVTQLVTSQMTIPNDPLQCSGRDGMTEIPRATGLQCAVYQMIL